MKTITITVAAPDVFCFWMGELPPASRFQHWMVPSSHEVNTKLGRERLQHPPVSPACTYSRKYLDPVV